MRDLTKTELLVGLVEAPQAGEHFQGLRKHIAHIVKNRKADAVQKVRHSNVWKTHLQIIEEHRAATHGKSGEGVTRSSLIQPKSAVGVASAAEETFRQRNKSLARGCGLRGVQQNRASERVLDADAGGPGENESLSRAAISKKRVIGRILDEQPAEVGLGAKITGGNSTFGGGVVAARAFQIAIAPVAHVEKIGNSYPGRLREERDEVVGDLNAGRLYAAVTETVGERR